MRLLILLFSLLATLGVSAFERFEGTFYLNRDRVTWVIIMNRDKGYEIFGPDGQYSTGKYRSTEDHLTFLEGNQKRRFHFDWDGDSLKFGYRESDNITPNGTLSNLPPSRESQNREHYINEREWISKGRPAFAKQAPPAARVDPPPSSVQPPPTIVAPAQNFDDIAGLYYLPAPNNQRELLSIGANGAFEYTALDGNRAAGTLTRVGGELLFIGPTHRRSFTLRPVVGGLEFTRKETDVLKADDMLGRMPPQEREPFTWLRTQAAAVQPLDAVNNVAGLNQLKGVIPPAQQPANPAPAVQGAAPNFNGLLGTYVHKPNPFIAETITVNADGSFTYKDSNGASAAGVFSLVGDTLTVTSGEVVRKFKAAQAGNTLTLTCAPDDAPKFKNDMASMSPTVLKVANYQKQ